MSQQEKLYEEVTEAKGIITNLCAEYTDVLWAVRPDNITVLGVSNKERPEKSNKLAVCKPIKGVNKSLMQINNISTRYVIELYFSDYNQWNNSQKIAVLFHELLHIDSEIGKTVKHDVEDFRIMVDKLGVDWFNDPELPNILAEKVDFDLSMRPNVPEDGVLEVDTGDEIVEEKEKSGDEPPKEKDKSDDDELF